MPKTMDEFLDRYRKAEALMSKLGCTLGFRDAEQWCEAKGDKYHESRLHMCRMIRNFAVHTPEGAAFLEPGAGRKWRPLTYLEGIEREMQSRLIARMDTASKHLDRSGKGTCRLDESVGDVLVKMSHGRRSYMLVVDGKKKAVDVVDIFEISAAVTRSRATKLKAILKARKPAKLVCVGLNTMMCDVPDGDVVFCTKTGDPNLPVSGVVKR